MAIMPQKGLFSWKEIEALGDLERLRLVLEYLPDEPLMQALERDRGKGRDDYPLRAVWNSLLGGVVYEHATVESLRRELRRNAQLRELCGFDPLKGEAGVPPASAYSRFLRSLFRRADVIDAMFDELVEQLRTVLVSLQVCISRREGRPRSTTSATARPRRLTVAALREGGSCLGRQNRS